MWRLICHISPSAFPTRQLSALPPRRGGSHYRRWWGSQYRRTDYQPYFFFETLQSRKTNATNATHASIPYAIRLSGCGVCSTQTPHMPPKRHTRPQNATLVLRDIVAKTPPQRPLAGIRSASCLRDGTVLQRQRTPSRLRDRKPVLPSGQSLVTSSDRAHRTESLQRTGIPPMGSPVMAAMVAADARRRTTDALRVARASGGLPGFRVGIPRHSLGLLLQPHSKLHTSIQGAGRNDYARDRPDAGCIQSVEHQGNTGCFLKYMGE